MKLVIGSDHAGFPMKADLVAFVKGLGHEVEDVGSYDPAPVDFPDIARKVAGAITSGQAERGLMVCGTGVGASIGVKPGYKKVIMTLKDGQKLDILPQ